MTPWASTSHGDHYEFAIVKWAGIGSKDLEPESVVVRTELSRLDVAAASNHDLERAAGGANFEHPANRVCRAHGTPAEQDRACGELERRAAIEPSGNPECTLDRGQDLV